MSHSQQSWEKVGWCLWNAFEVTSQTVYEICDYVIIFYVTKVLLDTVIHK